MTEAEWLTSGDSHEMLRSFKFSERKRRLFAAACFRRLTSLLPDPRQLFAIEAIDGLAEGTCERQSHREATRNARHAIPSSERMAEEQAAPTDDPHYVALMLYRELCSSSVAIHAVTAAGGVACCEAEYAAQCALLRDIFGNPFRPEALDPSWLTSTVVALAGGIYEERAFDRLPILADALMDAGCDHPDVLTHCRGDGPHVRGCWVVDLLLGKA